MAPPMLGIALAVGACVAGIGLLYGGGGLLVTSSASLARRAGMTPLLVGVTVVAFGTSAPELVVSVGASLSGQGEIALGNVLGSNVVNIGVVLGLAAVICPIVVRRMVVRREIIYLPVSTAIFALLALDGELSRLDGVLLLALMGAILALVVRASRREMAGGSAASGPAVQGENLPPAWRSVLGTLGGLGLLVLGAQLLIVGAVEIAVGAGIPTRVVGLTVVAIGTSLPELVTSLAAARLHQHDIALGNVVGSNLFNLVGIVGASSVVRPLAFGPPFHADFIVMMLFTIGLMLAARRRFTVTRGEGALLFAGYVAYVAVLLLR